MPTGLAACEREHRVERDVRREQQERDAHEPLGAALDPLHRLLVERAPGLGREAPKQDRSRDRLDRRVHAEADQRDAPGGETRGNRHDALDDVPAHGELL